MVQEYILHVMYLTGPLKEVVHLGCYETWRWHIPNAPETKQSHPV